MEELIDLLKRRGWRLASCESMTGGDFASRLTDISGASEVYVGGFVTYTDDAKMRLLGISADLLADAGAVSQETVQGMAVATRSVLNCDIAIAFSGNAGPGASSNQPVGRVFTAIAVSDDCFVYQDDFIGSRKDIKRLTVDIGIRRLKSIVNKENMR
jgi:PncC family amidohydrolase